MNLWHRRDYRWWLVSDTSGAISGGLRGFAIPLVAFLLSGSPQIAGLVGTATALVMVELVPLGGVWVDRHDRRTGVLIAAGFSRCSTPGTPPSQSAC